MASKKPGSSEGEAAPGLWNSQAGWSYLEDPGRQTNMCAVIKVNIYQACLFKAPDAIACVLYFPKIPLFFSSVVFSLLYICHLLTLWPFHLIWHEPNELLVPNVHYEKQRGRLKTDQRQLQQDQFTSNIWWLSKPPHERGRATFVLSY